MQPVCATSELEEDQARGIEIDGKSVVLLKKDGQVHAYLNWCPHLGIELNFMPDQFLDSDNAFLMCANHGALFDIDSGHCLSGPCSGDALMKIDVNIEGDQILLGDIPTP
jgi:nitrite reductase/ring-hydroxylating ferredoxin subunit